MTNTDQLLSLAERVERLEGPDDATDLAIAEFFYHARIGPNIEYDPELWRERYCWTPTGSIDSALTLRTGLWCVGSMEEGAFARVVPAIPGRHYGGEITIRAATVPLSMTEAFLRAFAVRARALSQETTNAE